MARSHSPQLWRWTLPAVLLWLVSCGGGGDAEPANSGPVSYYSDSLYRSGRFLGLMVFDGGLLYGFYQIDVADVPGASYYYAGFTAAKRPVEQGVNAPYQGFDFDFERGTALPVEVTLEQHSAGVYFGALNLEGAEDHAFRVEYAPVSTEPTQPGKLAHRYGGYARAVKGSAAVQANADPDGNLSIYNDAGCAMAGTLKARPLGNLYDATMTVGASCPVAPGRYSGPGLQSFNTSNVYLMLTSEDLSVGLFVHLVE